MFNQEIAKPSVPKPSEQRGFGIGAMKNIIDYQAVTKSSEPKPYGQRGFGIGTNWKNANVAAGHNKQGRISGLA